MKAITACDVHEKLRGVKRSFPLVVALVATTTAAGADEAKPRDVGTLIGGKVGLDAALLLVGGGLNVVGAKLLEPSHAGRAPLDGLGHRDRSPPLDTASDVTVTLGAIAGVGGGLATEASLSRHGGDLARAPLILFEAGVMAEAFTQMTKNAFGVCRPRDWDDRTRTCPDDDEAHRSFPSGHSSPLAGMAGAAWGLWMLPTGRRDAFAPLAIGMSGLALTMPVLREKAGAHSWVDTGTAVAIGVAIGFATAALHLERHDNPGASPPTTAQPLGLSGTW
jgi:hypothetical protein